MRKLIAWPHIVAFVIGGAILPGCVPRFPPPGEPIATAGMRLSRADAVEATLTGRARLERAHALASQCHAYSPT
jgi:hypothetical protein